MRDVIAPVGSARIGGLMGFPDLVAELGADPASLIARHGLDLRIFEDHDNVLPFTTIAHLLHAAAVATKCPHFGLLLGQRQSVALLGPVGFLMQHSPDVRSALQNLIRYVHLHVEGGTAEIAVRENVAQFSYIVLIPLGVGFNQVINVCLANELRFMQLLCGSNWFPTAVHFSFRAPPDVSPYRHLFKAPVRFDQENNAIFFSAQYLDQPVANADAALRKVLQAYIAQIEAQHTGNIGGQVRRVLRTLLPTGKCTVDRVAELFSMHRRTLYRHLRAHNTTFEEMVDAARHEIATRMLEESRMSLTQLAEMLGYNSSAAFTRAFRRWSGMAPSDWRTRHQT